VVQNFGQGHQLHPVQPLRYERVEVVPALLSVADDIDSGIFLSANSLKYSRIGEFLGTDRTSSVRTGAFVERPVAIGDVASFRRPSWGTEVAPPALLHTDGGWFNDDGPREAIAYR